MTPEVCLGYAAFFLATGSSMIPMMSDSFMIRSSTHCRYTGPYYLAMIVPVIALWMIASGTYAWIALGCVIIGGSKLIWWATERAWGKFS